MSLIAFHAPQARALAVLAVAVLFVGALPVGTAHAEAEPVTVTGTVEAQGDAGPIAIVSQDNGRFTVVPAATARALRAHAGKMVTARGVVVQDAAGNKTLSVLSFEIDEG